MTFSRVVSSNNPTAGLVPYFLSSSNEWSSNFSPATLFRSKSVRATRPAFSCALALKQTCSKIITATGSYSLEERSSTNDVTKIWSQKVVPLAYRGIALVPASIRYSSQKKRDCISQQIPVELLQDVTRNVQRASMGCVRLGVAG